MFTKKLSHSAFIQTIIFLHIFWLNPAGHHNCQNYLYIAAVAFFLMSFLETIFIFL